MNKYGFTINQEIGVREPEKRYHAEELELMTTFQLQEICRREKIIQGIINPMDKEELIRTVLRFRGADEFFLIKENLESGWESLQALIHAIHIKEKNNDPTGYRLQCSSKITAYKGLSIEYYDGLKIPYDKRMVGTNALVVGGDLSVCAILNVEQWGDRTDCLYLTKTSALPCRESEVKNYSLYCMEQAESEQLYRLYAGISGLHAERLQFYRAPLLDFEVKEPVSLSMPMAMDFGTTNTTAGVFLDNLYFESTGLRDGDRGLKTGDTNYVLFYDRSLNWRETILLPSVVGVRSIEAGKPEFLFGYDAIHLANSCYIDEGFCVFYDIKRWIGDYEKSEEITDRKGHRTFIQRKEILKAYFAYVIQAVKNRFKCDIKGVHISCPVKQKTYFKKLFSEILSVYKVEQTDMIDEGVSVLYNTISELIHKEEMKEGAEYKALIIDCGGGTTDLCSCSFRIWDRRVAYQIEIMTAYENGDTDFGGNNLTYRIMQLLKICVVNRLMDNRIKSSANILMGYDTDVFRFVDKHGTKALYRELEEVYAQAESYLPTRFKEFENQSRADYYMVKNNFYFLFHLAETVKKEFYNRVGTLRISLSSLETVESATSWLPVDKWRLSINKGKGLETIKEFPAVYFSIYEIELLLKADIYGIIHRFMKRMYEEDALEEYSIIKLTGQSCKIDIFRDALKEFVPGKTIQFKRRSGDLSEDFELKMTCVDGALKYLRDKKYGFADITIQTEEPALPYRITAFTHNGDEVVLIHRLKRGSASGMISRNMENLTLKLYLKDLEGKERYQYTSYTTLTDFTEKSYEQIKEEHGEHIKQKDTDDIVENEVKFFVWARPEDWAFSVVPVYRKEKTLFLGKEEVFFFENDGWVQNFFDGMK